MAKKKFTNLSSCVKLSILVWKCPPPDTMLSKNLNHEGFSTIVTNLLKNIIVALKLTIGFRK